MCILGVNTTHSESPAILCNNKADQADHTEGRSCLLCGSDYRPHLQLYSLRYIYFLPAGLVVCKFKIMKVSEKLRTQFSFLCLANAFSTNINDVTDNM